MSSGPWTKGLRQVFGGVTRPFVSQDPRLGSRRRTVDVVRPVQLSHMTQSRKMKQFSLLLSIETPNTTPVSPSYLYFTVRPRPPYHLQISNNSTHLLPYLLSHLLDQPSPLPVPLDLNPPRHPSSVPDDPRGRPEGTVSLTTVVYKGSVLRGSPEGRGWVT